MIVEVLYCTKHYPKLVEACARQCYCSEDKSTPSSHQLVRNLLKQDPPHLSIAQHGNVIVGLKLDNRCEGDELSKYVLKLIEGSKNYLVHSTDKDSSYSVVISGNIVAWMNAFKFTKDHKITSLIKEEFMKYDDLRFFIDSSFAYPEFKNPYIFDKTLPAYVIVADECDKLTEYEKRKHLTATVWVKTSRDISFQFNRHEAPISQQDTGLAFAQSTDLAGISQQSQRYVFPFQEVDKVSDFLKTVTQDCVNSLDLEYTAPEDIDTNEPIPVFMSLEGSTINLDTKGLLSRNEYTYNDMMEVIKTFYLMLFFNSVKNSNKIKRSQEIARSILTNNIVTRVFYTRTMERWEHFINLRRELNAQKEARRDMIPILKEFHRVGWFLNYVIDEENFTADIVREVNESVNL